jgi:hypothetical protein
MEWHVAISVTVIRTFKMFLPPILTQFTKVARIYDNFQDKIHLSYIYKSECVCVCVCMFKINSLTP